MGDLKEYVVFPFIGISSIIEKYIELFSIPSNEKLAIVSQGFIIG